MNKEELDKVLLSLSTISRQFNNGEKIDELGDDFIFSQLNLFIGTYLFATRELGLAEQTVGRSEAGTIRAYMTTRHVPVRFLIENYLTAIHFCDLSKEARYEQAYIFMLAGKIRIHTLDLKNLEFARKVKADEKACLEKIVTNRNNYIKMLDRYGKISENIPDNLDDFFDGYETVQGVHSKFGVKLPKHCKIDYMNELRENKNIPELIRGLFLNIYPLLSLENHPTTASVIDMFDFLKKDNQEQESQVKARLSANSSFLWSVGSAMETLYKGL